MGLHIATLVVRLMTIVECHFSNCRHYSGDFCTLPGGILKIRNIAGQPVCVNMEDR